jgi:ChrR Cupin-like domain
MVGHFDRTLAYRTPREETMRHVTFEPARPLDTEGMPWIPTGPGKSFRPLRFAADGWSELMRLEPGAGVPLHRHTREVHAFNLAGTREIFGTGERVGPAEARRGLWPQCGWRTCRQLAPTSWSWAQARLA